MTKLSTTFMNEHPLRATLTEDDWIRIQQVFNKELDDSHVTVDEIEAAHDVFYDAVAGKMQTHHGCLTLQ